MRKVYSEERWPEQDAWDQGYQAGLRRAQELAKEHCYADYYNHDPSEYLVVDFVDFDASIDAEVAKEGK